MRNMSWMLLGLSVLFSALGGCQCSKPPTVEAQKKEGEACKTDESCATGLCDGAPGFQAVCVRKCSSICRTDEVCVQLTPNRFSCQKDQRKLCQPCLVDADCPYPSDKCLVMNGEKVCGRDCAYDQSCPTDYLCLNGRGVDGQPRLQQCQPANASCACLARGDLNGPCELVNEYGTCRATKICDLVSNKVVCGTHVPSAEICNGIDDNCDNRTDENQPVLQCGVGGCARTTSACVDGGVAVCVPGQPTAELCNNIDDNCNGVTDEGFAVENDVNNCGGCGNKCQLSHATATCAGRVCKVGSCDTGWGNCDSKDDNGCETNLNTDSANCSQCGNNCVKANSTASCVGGLCQYQCPPGRYDINGDPTDGCEYQCTFVSATDLPDLDFIDANCDGIDGEVARAIFVSPNGSDTNAGTKSAPKRTLAAAMTAVATTGKRDVYLAGGAYVGPLVLNGTSGMNVAGAYHPTTWQRNFAANQVTVQGGNPGLTVEGSQNVLVQALRIEGGLGTPSAYGGWFKDSSAVKLESLDIQAGNGADGQAGATGNKGADGGVGGTGGYGCISGHTLACDLISTICPAGPESGAGGTSNCSSNGGNGGRPGNKEDVPGAAGSPAPSGGGLGGLGLPINQGPGPFGLPYAGTDGSSGLAGSNGTGALTLGGFSASGFVPVSGASGGPGTSGKGGGGGGGGCGGKATGTASCDTWGSAGGGGGAGGCGGEGGVGGAGGGASVGVYLYRATVSAQGVVVRAGSGGRGGSGGTGAPGGEGGAGGASTFNPDGDNNGTSCRGGPGGKGGAGGPGGAGGGGAGGSSIGLVTGGSSTWNVVSGVTVTYGTAGGAGPSAGNPGVAGEAAVTKTF